MICSFTEDLEFSQGGRMQTDMDILKQSIRKCVSVKKTSIEEDKKGVDYIVTLEDGATIRVDAKRRRKGASKSWTRRDEPELAIETWSVITTDGQRKKGWTFNTGKECDLILYVFDPEDTDKYYLIPFPLLRQASINNLVTWDYRYRQRTQRSIGWKSKCMMVPASVVLEAVKAEMVKQLTGDIEYPEAAKKMIGYDILCGEVQRS